MLRVQSCNLSLLQEYGYLTRAVKQFACKFPDITFPSSKKDIKIRTQSQYEWQWFHINNG